MAIESIAPTFSTSMDDSIPTNQAVGGKKKKKKAKKKPAADLDLDLDNDDAKQLTRFALAAEENKEEDDKGFDGFAGALPTGRRQAAVKPKGSGLVMMKNSKAEPTRLTELIEENEEEDNEN